MRSAMGHISFYVSLQYNSRFLRLGLSIRESIYLMCNDFHRYNSCPESAVAKDAKEVLPYCEPHCRPHVGLKAIFSRLLGSLLKLLAHCGCRAAGSGKPNQ